MNTRLYIKLRKPELLDLFENNINNIEIVLEIYNEIKNRSRINKNEKQKVKNTLLTLISENAPPKPTMISVDDAKRGIYIDFEGLKVDEIDGVKINPAPPSLIGILYERYFEQINMDDTLTFAADHHDLETNSLSSVVTSLIIRAYSDNCFIFGFTEHDLNMINKFTTLGDIVEGFYINGAKLARKWNNRFGWLEENENNSLKDFAKYLDQTYEGETTPAAWIRNVRKRSQNKNSFSDISQKAQEDWENLLAYNKKDCCVLRDLMILVAKEYEEIR